ncbi:MAG: MarR family transcriptional regulator [Candidatus Uhrbacteria bacterium]|nr:MarR family transcriptional regulator [Candidatus Uhrbacteria bacterium]
MDGYETVFAALGLTPKEARVYLALLEEGPSSVRQLAAATSINRGTIYDVLKELQAHGLARFYNAETRQYFVAASPKRLEELAAEKRDGLVRASSELAGVIPHLEALYDGGDHTPVARMFEGSDGVRSILEDVLLSMKDQTGAEYYVYSSSAVRDAGLYTAFPDYTKRRLDYGIRLKNISFGKRSGGTSGLDERKWIDGLAGAPTYVLMYANKVAHIFLDKKGEFVGLIIDNRAVYETQKLLFLELWERLT